MRKLGMLLVLGSLSLLAACGGGGGGGSTSSSITGVTVSCSPTTVTSGQTSQCSASVSGTGSFSTGVNWSTTAGSISSSGLLTAPVVSASELVTVTATSTQDSTKSGTSSVTVNPQSAGANIQPIVVDAGPDPTNFISANVAYTTVTICIPGTSNCQTIDHVMVDTGSSGFRVLSGVLNLSLPAELSSNGNTLGECLVFVDGYVWGTIATADITVGGEKASAAPVQIMLPSTSSPPVPSSCSSQTTGPNEGGSVDAFGANAIIGVGLFQQDCGLGCTNANNSPPDVYYDCPSSGCNPIFVPLAQQVPNPVSLFANDNNGVIIQLPTVADGGAATADGSMIFGIGTESNNGLGAANVYPVPDSGTNAGDFITTYGGNSYPQSFIDSGSNGYFFLDSATTGIPTCPGDLSQWYCPATSPDNLSASNQGQSTSGPTGSSINVSFSIENTSNLFNTNNTAFSTLSGTYPGAFDWGLSFFYGRSVFTAIENMGTPGGTGPYFAY